MDSDKISPPKPLPPMPMPPNINSNNGNESGPLPQGLLPPRPPQLQPTGNPFAVQSSQFDKTVSEVPKNPIPPPKVIPPSNLPPTVPPLQESEENPVKSVEPLNVQPTAEEQKNSAPKNDPETVEYYPSLSTGLFSWINQTVSQNKVLSDVAAKAKLGMEQVLTTLDPGMKGFLSGDEPVVLNVANISDNSFSFIKEGFERVFATCVTRMVPSAHSDLPVLVEGFGEALFMCKERLQRVVKSKLVNENAIILVGQPFIFRADDQQLYTATKLALLWKGHELDATGQLLPVSNDTYDFIKKRSKLEGKTAPHFSISVAVAEKQLSTENNDQSWAGLQPPYNSGEFLSFAASLIAQQFMKLHSSMVVQSD